MSELIEDCYALSAKEALRCADGAKRLVARVDGNDFGVQCQLNATIDPSAISIRIGGGVAQEIAMEWQDITYGRVAFFKCPCGCRVRKLYLPPGARQLLCRHCWHLRYELSNINRSSVHGKLFYRTNRMIKLASKRESMRRIFCRGNFTRRYQGFLKLCDKAGFAQISADARNLLEAVRAQSF